MNVRSATRSTPSGSTTTTSVPTDTATPACAYGDSLVIGCADNRRRTPAIGRVPPGRPAPLAHRRGQRHQLGTGTRRQCRGADGFGGTAFHRGDLPPCTRADAATARPADRSVDQTAGRGLRGGPGPRRPRPHHQPDDGIAGPAGRPPHDRGYLPVHGPLPGHGSRDGQPHLRHPQAVERLAGADADPERGHSRRTAGLTAHAASAHESIGRETKKEQPCLTKRGRRRSGRTTFSGSRGHPLMTKELGEKIPALRSTRTSRTATTFSPP